MYKLDNSLKARMKRLYPKLMWMLWWKHKGHTDGDKVLLWQEIGLRESNRLNEQSKNWAYCYICGDSFSWKAAHYIGFTGCFPYCQQCHRDTSIVIKIKAMLKLVISWHTVAPEFLWSYRGIGGYIRVFVLSCFGILIGQ